MFPCYFRSEACANKGVSLAIFLSSSFQSCPPPSFVLSERPNILALRSLRKAAAEVFARRDGTTGLDRMRFQFQFARPKNKINDLFVLAPPLGFAALMDEGFR